MPLRGVACATALALAACATGTAGAQSFVTSVAPSISIGAAFMPLRASAHSGVSAGAGLDFALHAIPVLLRLEGTYTRFVDPNGPDGRQRAVGAMLDVVAPLHLGVVTPYLIAGKGRYDIAAFLPNYLADCNPQAPQNCQAPGSTQDWGWSLGGGIDFPLGPVTGRVEARYYRVGDVDSRYAYVPVTVGVQF